MRILDLGCGLGQDLSAWGVAASDEVTGLDIDGSVLPVARVRFPMRTYVQGRGESLPFANDSFDRVISEVAIPYMNIQRALAEIHRILVPGGSLSLSLHDSSFTLSELLHNAIPKPIPTIYRLYVAANGLFFHCTGKTVGFLNQRTESFQTRRGMSVALRSAGFVNPSFRKFSGVAGMRFLVDARKPVYFAGTA